MSAPTHHVIITLQWRRPDDWIDVRTRDYKLPLPPGATEDTVFVGVIEQACRDAGHPTDSNPAVLFYRLVPLQVPGVGR